MGIRKLFQCRPRRLKTKEDEPAVMEEDKMPTDEPTIEKVSAPPTEEPIDEEDDTTLEASDGEDAPAEESEHDAPEQADEQQAVEEPVASETEVVKSHMGCCQPEVMNNLKAAVGIVSA